MSKPKSKKGSASGSAWHLMLVSARRLIKGVVL